MIPIHNIYYMLSYAFQILNEQGYKNIATESFENVAELCAAILSKGISTQLKRGLGREYIEHMESLSSMRGRVDLAESIKTRSFLKKQIICSYDEFSVNFSLNQILKTTMELLLREDISIRYKRELKKLLMYFNEVDTLNVNSINWNVKYHRNNQTYHMLVSIFYLVIEGLLQTNSNGTTYLMDFFDEQRMSRLFEKFVFKYYRREFPQLSVSASQIPWSVDDGLYDMLPVMQSDVMISHEDKILIIDTKYYSQMTQAYYGTHALHSGNLYQIFTYVKNKSAEFREESREVSGMLLYAQTDELVQPNHTYEMSGNKISVKTLNLDCHFADIADQLNEIVKDYFGIQ